MMGHGYGNALTKAPQAWFLAGFVSQRMAEHTAAPHTSRIGPNCTLASLDLHGLPDVAVLSNSCAVPAGQRKGERGQK